MDARRVLARSISTSVTFKQNTLRTTPDARMRYSNASSAALIISSPMPAYSSSRVVIITGSLSFVTLSMSKLRPHVNKMVVQWRRVPPHRTRTVEVGTAVGHRSK